MRFTNIILSITLFVCAALTAPVASESVNIPSDSILGYMDFTQDLEVGVVAYSNETFSGLIFFNTTIVGQDLNKRDAGWMRLRLGQPMKKRDANADAGWMRLRLGQPM